MAMKMYKAYSILHRMNKQKAIHKNDIEVMEGKKKKILLERKR